MKWLLFYAIEAENLTECLMGASGLGADLFCLEQQCGSVLLREPFFMRSPMLCSQELKRQMMP